MPETLVEQRKRKIPVPKELKKHALDAIVVDTLADELPVEVQEKLPKAGVLVKQTPEGKITVHTDIVSELPKAGIVATPEISEETVAEQKKTIADAIGPITIAQPILEHTDPNKAEHASEALNFLSDQMKEEADALIEKNRLVIAKGLLIASHVLKTAAKTAKFFSKFKKHRKNKK